MNLQTGSPRISHLNRATLSPGSNPLYHYQTTAALNPPQAAGTGGLSLPPSFVPATPIIQVDDETSPSERKCTNLGWLSTFCVSMAIGVYVCFHALARGRPMRLMRGTNFKGLVCGVDSAVKNRPYVYFPLDPSDEGKHTLLHHDRRCLASCPSEDDVTSKGVVPMTKRVTRQHPDLGSSMVLEFEVATPAYATEVVANAYCLPLDRRLRNQMLVILSSLRFQLPFAVGSLASAWPIIFGTSTIALLIALLATWVIRQLPVLTVYGSHCGAIASLLIGGIMCVLWGARGAASDPEASAASENDYMSRLFSVNYTLAMACGLAMLPSGLFFGFLWLKSPASRSRAARVLDMTGDVFANMPNLIVGPIITSGVAFLFLWLWTFVFLYLCGLASVKTNPELLLASSGGNGSTSVVPLHQTSYFPFGGVVAIVFWIAIFFWVLEILKALTQFVTCYAGTIWYFASPEGADEKDMGWCPVLVALSLGLANHFGSFAFGGVLMGLSAPLRTLGTWASVKNDYSSDESVTILSTVLAPFKGLCRSVVDFLTVGGFVEMAISSADFWTAMQVSSRRLGLPASPASRLSASLNSTFTSFSLAVSLFLSLAAYSSAADASSIYGLPRSPHFVSAPIFVAISVFVFCWTYTSLFAVMWTSLADSLFYSYLVESSSPAGEVDENPVEKLHAHSHIRDLIIETMDEFSY